MPETEVDLAALFNEVAKTLKQNQASLNEADDYNHNHGDNMVKNFKVISKAVKQTQGASPAEQLAYASQTLRRSSSSGSAQLYAEGLTRAAEQVRGQSSVNEKNALSLVQALLGGTAGTQSDQGPQAGSGAAGSGDMMSGLMGALLGGASGAQGSQPSQGDAMGDLMGALLGGTSGTQSTQPTQAASGDMMGDLMGALMGGAAGGSPSQAAQGSQGEGGLNLGTLLNAGMAFFQAQQQGASTVEALISAVMAGSQMNSTPHQSQSGQLVAGTLLNALGLMLGGKK